MFCDINGSFLIVVDVWFLLTIAPPNLLAIYLFFVVQFVYHSAIIRTVELYCDLLVILTEPMWLAYITTFAHLEQVIVEAHALVMQLPRYVILFSGACPINLFAFGGLMVLSVVNITTQTLPLDSKPDLFYGQRHSFFFVQLDIMVVTHVG